MVSPLPLSPKKNTHSPDEVSDDELDVPPASSKRARFPHRPLNHERHARIRTGPDLPSILLQPSILTAPGPASPFSSIPGSAGYLDRTRFELSELTTLFNSSYSNEYMLQGLSSLSMIARDIAGSDIHPSFSRESLSGKFTNPVYLLRGHPEMRRVQRHQPVALDSHQDEEEIVAQHVLIDELDSFFEANGVGISQPGSSEETIGPFEGEDEEVRPRATSSAAALAVGASNALAAQQNAVQSEQARTTSIGASSVENKEDEAGDHTHPWSLDRGSMDHD